VHTLFKVTIAMFKTTKKYFVELIFYCNCLCQFVKSLL